MEEKKICPFCESEVLSTDNFCAKCGEPLNDLAKRTAQKKDILAQVKLINVLIGEVSDRETIKKLGSLAKKLSEEI